MASDYETIREENRRNHGAKAGEVGEFLANLYGDSAHFILELLQNAEDALRRRTSESNRRTVKFDLATQQLRVSHYGRPFDEDDVKGICDLVRGTKKDDLTQIGRFGIGFKSVYKFTDQPQVHSGDEDFRIENYVWPAATQPIPRDPDETVFVLPLSAPDEQHLEIADGLRQINLDTLLFLRQINSIEWSVPSGESGKYVRQTCRLAEHVRRVVLTAESTANDDADQEWLVFSKPMHGNGGELAGHVEVAFSMKDKHVHPMSQSQLVVFFPTVVETNLGLCVQGPYRTTPGRDNVPKGDPWNQACVKNTGDLLVDALIWLRESDLLDVNVLQCLPLDEDRFDENSLFAPLYTTVKRTLRSKRLLPLLDGGYARADRVKLGRSKELRELVSGKRLKQLFRSSNRISWLTDLISQDRTPELRRYLMDDLGVEEVTPTTILPRLRSSFLAQQSDAWMCRLYGFLNGQAALHRQAAIAPIVRLSNGEHVPALADGSPQAFLPGDAETGFPTVRKRACRSPEARRFLGVMGLSERHLVDDVIRNVLPKYDEDEVCVPDSQYAADIERILAASKTDVAEKRAELIEQLGVTSFVRAISTGDGAECLASPAGLHLATKRLKALFMDVSGFQVVDDRCGALRHDSVRSLLEECGAVSYWRPVRKDHAAWNSALPKEFLAELREKSGYAQTSWQSDTIVDWELSGLKDVLAQLCFLNPRDQRIRAKYIWEELVQLEGRRGKAVFRAEYRWTHYGNRRQQFDSAFIRQLNGSDWIPTTDESAGLRRPNRVLFDSLGWPDDPFVLSKIRFKPPIVDQLATEAGFEPAMLDRLKVLGITSLEDLEKRLPDQPDEGGELTDGDLVGDAVDGLDVAVPDPPSIGDPAAETGPASGDSGTRPTTADGGLRPSEGPRLGGERVAGDSSRREKANNAKAGRTRFVSYVAVGGNDDRDPDGLVHEDRMALERKAIAFILDHEPEWERTSQNNEGFDLFKVADGQECAWCEVKAMKGTLDDRPVGMSRAQFKCAQEHGEAYWLYVVEQAGSEYARIVRIRDPAGKAKTFTFDKGWLNVAKINGR